MRWSVQIPVRLVARLRARYPLLFLMPGFAAGQSAAYFCAVFDFSLLRTAALSLLAVMVFRAKRSLLLAGFIAGTFSGFATLPVSPAVHLSSDKSYFVEVLRDPQRPRVGQVKLALAILGELNGAGAQTMSALTRPIKVSCKAVDLPWRNISHQLAGSRFIIRAQFHPIRPPLNPFGYDATLFRHGFVAGCKIAYAASVSEIQSAPLISRFRMYLRQRVSAVLGDGRRAGLALAMGIGVRDAIDESTEEAFKLTGLAHLLVASGFQVTLLFCSVCGLFKLSICLVPRLQRYFHIRTVAVILGLGASVLFVGLVGLEGSVVRALFAIVFAICGQILERGTLFTNSILLSLLLVSLVWPGCYFEPGIQLTFAALWGLAAAGDDPNTPFLLRYVKACLLACLATSTIALAWFGRISIWTFFLNPILAPMGSVIGCKGMLCALALYIGGLDPGALGLRAVGVVLEYYANLVEYLAGVPAMSFEFEGAWRWTAVASLAIVWMYVVWRNLRDYARAYNLHEPVARLKSY